MDTLNMVGPVKNGDSTLNCSTTNTHHRLQLLAQAIEKVESECSQKKQYLPSTISSKKQHAQSPSDSLPMASPHQQELLMKLLAQQNMAAVMAAAAAAAQLQAHKQQHHHQQQKPEPISPPSTSSASSQAESPIDFSSRRSSDENLDCPSPTSPMPSQQQILATMFQNLQSSSSNSSFPYLLTSKNGKPTRPFKAYPREPLMMPLGFSPTAGSTPTQTSLLAEAASRATPNRKRLVQSQERLKQQLQQQQQQQQQQQEQKQQQSYFISSSGAQILQPPKKRHRTMTNEDLSSTETHQTLSSASTPPMSTDDPDNSIRDEAYWERRRKNNEAAKRSRDARRAKEDEIAIRATLLEQENIKLRLEVSQLKQETAKLRCMVFTAS